MYGFTDIDDINVYNKKKMSKFIIENNLDKILTHTKTKENKLMNYCPIVDY